MPCLNEAETLKQCIDSAKQGLRDVDLEGEIIVADNGSTDGSIQIAEQYGARVVHIEKKGYGSALRGGIEAAIGSFVVMGDADSSYDFSKLKPFVDNLRTGFDLVMGNRFKGGIMHGAMPWMHRWIGNPILSTIGRIFFHSKIGDFHCGLRAFSRSAYDRMELKTTGMEFASEMVIKSTLNGLSITEVPIVLHPDGRTRPAHLRTWRDGWRHLRFMLLFSPRWLFLMPGILLFALGAIASLVLTMSTIRVQSVVFDVHTLLVSALLCLLGYQLIIFALFTKSFAISEGFHPAYKYDWLLKYLRLETGVIAGLVMALAGLMYVGLAVWNWKITDFGEMDPSTTMRRLVPGSIFVILGVQTVFASFFMSILGLRREGSVLP